jgi:hypothetical protein
VGRWCRRSPFPGDSVHGDGALVARDDGIELDQIEVSINQQARDLGSDVSDGSDVDWAAAPVAAEKPRPREAGHRRLD